MAINTTLHLSEEMPIHVKKSVDGSVHWVSILVGEVGEAGSDLTIFTPTESLAERLADVLEAIRDGFNS